jgi:SAM-dependent methyltransferase
MILLLIQKYLTVSNNAHPSPEVALSVTKGKDIWDEIYSTDNSFLGDQPSVLAREAILFFERFGCKRVLELGCGQGRDAIFFARNNLEVRAYDSSKISVSQLNENARRLGFAERIKASQIDLSRELPKIERDAVDAVYSNLFLCMPFSDEELQKLFDFIHRILPGGGRGLHIFSIRDKNKDKSFGKGKVIGKDTFDIDGFKVRFFTKEEILCFANGFRTVETREDYEEPCSLILVFSLRD